LKYEIEDINVPSDRECKFRTALFDPYARSIGIDELIISLHSKGISTIKMSDDTIIANMSVGSNPGGIAYDSSNGYVYVANSNSSIVSVISTSPQVTKIYAVTFTESGLPSGMFWSVNFNVAILNSTADSTTFLVSNGTYSYTIGSVPGYSASPSSGNITVNGANVTQAITFRPTTTTLPFSYIIIAIALIAAVIGAVVAMRRRKK